MESIPDFCFIRKNVPIVEVAKKLNLDVVGKSAARCWRPDAHQNRDRSPSIGFDREKNRAKCFVCDARAMSNLDLVMAVLNCSLREAAIWMTRRFEVPPLPRGTHLARRCRVNPAFRVGTGEPRLELIVRSGVFASLSNPQSRVLVALAIFADNSTGRVEISYPALMRYSGIGSRTTLARALRYFANIGLLAIQREESAGLRAVNQYTLTVESSAFQDFLARSNAQHREEVETEKTIREEIRTQRAKARIQRSTTQYTQSVPMQKNTVHPEWTVNLENLDPKTIRIPVKPSLDSALTRTFLSKRGRA